MDLYPEYTKNSQTQQQETNNTIKNMGKELKQTFHQRGYKNGK